MIMGVRDPVEIIKLRLTGCGGFLLLLFCFGLLDFFPPFFIKGTAQKNKILA